MDTKLIPPSKLSARENETIGFIFQGYDIQHTANNMGVRYTTVKQFLRRAAGKLSPSVARSLGKACLHITDEPTQHLRFTPSPNCPLSAIELKVLEFLSEDIPTKEMRLKLGCNSSVDHIIVRTLKKLDCHTRSGAVAKAIWLGYI